MLDAHDGHGQRPQHQGKQLQGPRETCLFRNSWGTRFGPRSARRTRTSSLVCASSAYRPTSRSHSPTRRCDGRACATRAARSHSRKAGILFVLKLRLWTCQIYNYTEISMRCRTDSRATCSSIYVIWALQFFSSTFGHRPLFFSSTPVVSGGASVDSDRPLPGDTTRCLLFHRYRGGITPG